MKKRLLVITGGGDCPGLNAVIRAIVKRMSREKDWEVIGSIEAFNGIIREPTEIMVLDDKSVAGIHFRGGTILGTTNKGGPLAWPVKDEKGNWVTVNRVDEMLRKFQLLGIEAVINIGGDGSQKISQLLYKKGCKIIGIPKTIDNDLSFTDFTFGFQTAVQTATESIDKLVTTAASHNRVIILEVMGRDAGWIALHSAIAGGAEVCLIPEIPYDIDIVLEKVRNRYNYGRGFANIVVAEGAKPKDGDRVYEQAQEPGNENVKLGGIASKLVRELKLRDSTIEIRETVLGHLQRGGTPVAYDRVLAAQFGVKAVELVLEERFGEMVSYRHPEIVSVALEEVVQQYNYISRDSYLIKTARGLDICLGD